MTTLDGARLIKERSDPLMAAVGQAGFTLADAVWLGLSPIAFNCNEAWKPVLERLCASAGYCWEWTPNPHQPLFGDIPPYQTRAGEAVLTKA